MLELATPYRDGIVGIGLDSTEVGNPPSKFKQLYEEAATQGYLPVAHAGGYVGLSERWHLGGTR